jgi:predicted metalloprotease
VNPRFVIGVLVIAALVGCGSSDETARPDDADSGNAQTATSTPTATTSPLVNTSVERMPTVPAGSAVGAVPEPASPSIGDPNVQRAAFDSAQVMWQDEFDAAGLGYDDAHLVFFHTLVHTPCGLHGAQTGPFYCPAAATVYLNSDFFDDLARSYNLRSPFAASYVTAHEVAHHVQQLLGLHARVADANQSDPAGTNGRSVLVELQADCYAGVWLHTVAQRGELSREDLEDILRAAAAVGDDYRRERAGADLAPETWTHGSSAQRVHWLSVGVEGGSPADCDTFTSEGAITPAG